MFAFFVCVFVFFSHSFWTSTSLDVPAGVTQEGGHTGFLFCGACLNFSREKDSAIPFPRRPWSRILCTNDLIVLHPLGIFILFFSFLVRKIPFAGIELTSQRVRGLRGTSELPGVICIFGRWYTYVFKRPVDPGSSVGTSEPSDTLGREFDPGKRDFSH